MWWDLQVHGQSRATFGERLDGVVVDEYKADKARQRLLQFFPPTGWSEPRLEGNHQLFSWNP